MHYPSSKNKGADQLCSYCAADLRLLFAYVDCWFSGAAAQLYINLPTTSSGFWFRNLAHSSINAVVCSLDGVSPCLKITQTFIYNSGEINLV